MRNLLIVFLYLIPDITAAQKTAPKQILIEPKFLLVSNAGLDLPLGDFADTHTVGVNVGLGGYCKASSHLKIGLQIDENYFIGKKINGTTTHYEPENIIRLVTSVLINNGSSLIIGGLHAGIAHASSNGFSHDSFTFGASVGIPVFGKIPVLGTFFRSKGATVARAETLIFLTPRIVRDRDGN